MGKYLLGIDNGLTLSKAAIFDLRGHEVQVASRKLEPEYPHPGWTERNMELLWEKTAEAIREAIERSGIKAEEIAGIGNCGHGNGLYLLDRAGRPLRPGILSLDTRAADVVAEWQRRDLHSQAFPYTTQSFWPAQPNALLAWLKTNEPQKYEHIGTAFLCKDYIKYRLTGQITTDFTDMSGTSLMDVRNKCYSRELLELFDIAEIYDALPPLKQSFEVIGQVTPEAAESTGLAIGTPVVGGVFDVDASALGAGAINPGQLCLIAGTWSINEVVTEEPILDPTLFMTSIYTVPGRWLTIEASATSATNLEWFVAQCCGDERTEAEKRGISVYEVCNEKVASLPAGGTDIIFHPFLYGSNVQPTARAGFYGIAGWHSKAHLLRALYEGVVYSHLSHVEKLRAAGARIESARLTGGGSRSQVWTQIFADALELTIEVPGGEEIGARGAAISAGIGAGVYRSHEEAVEQAVSIVRVQEPVAENAPLYLARYAEYERLLRAMQEPWDHLSKLADRG